MMNGCHYHDVSSLRRSVGQFGEICPLCGSPFDLSMKRRVTDACGHERCYTCMTRYQNCPLCVHNGTSVTKVDVHARLSSGSLLGSSLGSSVSHLIQGRPKMKTNGHFAAFMQTKNKLLPGNGASASRSPPPLRDVRTHPPLPPSAARSNTADSAAVGSSTVQSSRSQVPASPRLLRLAARHHRASRANTVTIDHPHALSELCVEEWPDRSTMLKRLQSFWALDNDEDATCRSDENALYTRLGLLLGPGAETRSPDSQRSRSSRSAASSGHESRATSLLKCDNTSPVSTLTGSSESEIAPIRSAPSRDSFGSLMSVSLADSSASVSQLTAGHRPDSAGCRSGCGGAVDDVSAFLTQRTQFLRRSARCQRVTAPVHAKARLAQYRPQQLSLRPLFFEVAQQEQDPLFLGRHWLFDELSRLLLLHEQQTPGAIYSSAGGAGGCVISGGVGTGKTAALLQLVEYSCFGRRWGRDDCYQDPLSLSCGNRSRTAVNNGSLYSNVCTVPDELRCLGDRVVGYHFCQADNSVTCMVAEFVHSLAAQLCQCHQLTAYRDHVLQTPALQSVLALRSCVSNPSAALVRGILQPLCRLQRANKLSSRTCLILIDALCEAEYHKPEYGDDLVSFLACHLSEFPSWLKLVVTVRTQMQGIASPLPFQRICMDRLRDTEELQKDLTDYVSFRINNSPSIRSNIQVCGARVEGSAQSRFVSHLTKSSKGSFLFVKLTLDLIERGHLVMKSSSYRVLPLTLSEIFLLNFNLKFRTQRSYDSVAPILCSCLASLRPMNAYEIYHSVNAGFTGQPISWDDFLTRFKMLSGFLVKRMDDTYMPFHPSLREWLQRRDDGDSDKFLLDARSGHARLALRMSRMEAPLDSRRTLQMAHHVLKAHLYRKVSAGGDESAVGNPERRSQLPPPRQLQALWLCGAAADLTGALTCDWNACSPNVGVSTLLLLAGASADAATRQRDSAPLLGVCAAAGHDDMVRLLLRFSAAVDAGNARGATPLMLAAADGQSSSAQLLLAAGASVQLCDAAGRCALVHAAIAGHLSVVENLLWCDWPQSSSSSGLSPPPLNRAQAAQQALIAAAGNGHEQLVDYLLDMEEVSVNAVDALHGESALTMAAAAGHCHVVDALMRRGADVRATNARGAPPLLGAARQGHWDVSVALLAQGAPLEQADEAGRTALMLVAGEGHMALLDLLLSKGASVSQCDGEGMSALSWACLKGQGAAVQTLLDAGSDINHDDNAGRTPLDLAAFYGDPVVVTTLLELGAVIEHVDRKGMRPLDRAIGCGNVQVVQCFLRKGAKLGTTTWSMADGKPDITFTLLNKLNDDGMTLYKKCRIQEADHRFTYALRKFPEREFREHEHLFRRLHINLLLNLSRCKRKLGDLEKSADLATLAMSVRPEAFEPYFFRAKARHAQQRLDEALADLSDAMRLSPSNREVRRTLTQVRDQMQPPASSCSAGGGQLHVYGSVDPLMTQL